MSPNKANGQDWVTYVCPQCHRETVQKEANIVYCMLKNQHGSFKTEVMVAKR